MEQRFLESRKAILAAPCAGPRAGSDGLEAPWEAGRGFRAQVPGGQARMTPHPCVAGQGSNRNVQGLGNCSPRVTDLYLALLGTHVHLFGPLFVTCQTRLVILSPLAL